MDSREGAGKKLDAFLDIYGNFIDSHRNFHRLLSTEINLLHHFSIKEVITIGILKNYELVKNIILDGIASGIFINVDLVTLNIIALVPRIFSGSPFITDIFLWQQSGLSD